MIDFLACPRCAKRVDETPEGDEGSLSGILKKVKTTGQWGSSVEVIYCPHCGTVLAVLPRE